MRAFESLLKPQEPLHHHTWALLIMSSSHTPAPKKIWSPKDVTKTNIDIFRRYVNSRRGLQLQNSRELQAWTTNPRTAPDWWLELFEFEKLKPGVTPTLSLHSAVHFSSKINLNKANTDLPLFAPRAVPCFQHHNSFLISA